jgi:hypothetical protein
MKPLMDENVIKNEKVLAIDILDGLLVSGYSDGSIAIWDLIHYKLLKHANEMHHTPITNLKIYYVSNNSH